MSMTIAVTRNLPGRFHGFLASCLLEIAPGVYATPRMRKAVRERLWSVMADWEAFIPDDGGLLMLWADDESPSGMGMQTLGWSKKEFVNHEGLWLAVAPLTSRHDLEELTELTTAEQLDE
jgi:CRISPR-associated protein Cas2